MKEIAGIWCDKKPSNKTIPSESNFENTPNNDLNNDLLNFQSDHKETSLFWKHYIISHIKTISAVPGQIEAIQAILKILDTQGDCSSIDPNDKETPERLHILKEVSLREHSIAVARTIVDLAETRQDDFKVIIGKAIIAGLAHDIGKLFKIDPVFSHSHNSAKWTGTLLKGHKNIKIIIDAIKFHHLPDKQIKIQNMILEALKLADVKVRDEELAAYKHNTSVVRAKEKDISIETPVISTLSEQDQNIINIKSKPEADIKLIYNHKELLKKLKTKINQNGFEAFVFDNRVFIRPSIFKQSLSELPGLNPDVITDNRVESLIDPSLNISSGKYKLKFKKFKGKRMPPQSYFYFVMDVEQLGNFTELLELIPRDKEGRWLHKILKEG